MNAKEFDDDTELGTNSDEESSDSEEEVEETKPPPTVRRVDWLDMAANAAQLEFQVPWIGAGLIGVNDLNSDGETALHVVVGRNIPEAVSLLLQFDADVNAVDRHRQTALHIAATNNCVKIVDTLVRNGADLGLEDDYKHTPLDVAVVRNSPAVAAYLSIVTKCGARLSDQLIDSTDDDGRTALHYFAEYNNAGAIELSLNHGADIGTIDHKGRSPLVEALVNKSWNAAKLLFDSRDDAVKVSRCDAIDGASHSKDGSTFLHSFALLFSDELPQEATDILSRVFSAYGRAVVDHNGNTPLHEAFSESFLNIALTHMDINLPNFRGQTPLHMAFLRGDSEAVYLLLKSGANFNVVDEELNTPLHYCDDSLISYIRYLWVQNSIAFDKRVNIFGEKIPLLENGDCCVDCLGNAPVHVDAGVNDYRMTQKTYRDNQRTEISWEVLDMDIPGGVLSEPNVFGQTPLQLLFCSYKRRMAFDRLLLETVRRRHITDTDDHGRTILHLMVMTEHPIFEYNFENYYDSFNQMACMLDMYERTPLHYLAYRSQCCCLQPADELLECKKCLGRFGFANIDAADKFGRTPLHYAAMKGQMLSEKMRIYLKKKRCRADENLADIHGFSPKKIYAATLKRESPKIHIDANRKDSICKLLDDIQATEWQSFPGNLEQIRRFSACLPKKLFSFTGEYQITHADATDGFTSKVKNAVVEFTDRLAAAIGREDKRLQCDVLHVGSSSDGTQIGLPNEFDFNFRLTKLSGICEVMTSSGYPAGFVVLRKSQNAAHPDDSCNTLFSDDGTLHSTKVNFAFQVALIKVLSSRALWDEEEFVELNYDNAFYRDFRNIKTGKLVKTIRLLTCRAVSDIPAGFQISVDIVPIVHIAGWWPADARPVNVLSTDEHTRTQLLSEGCNFVFEQPYRKYHVPYSPVQYVKISFACAECILLGTVRPVQRAALMVVKHFLYAVNRNHKEQFSTAAEISSHVLKTAAFWTFSGIGKRCLSDSSDKSCIYLVRCILQRLGGYALQCKVPVFFMPPFYVPVWKFEAFVGHAQKLSRRPLKGGMAYDCNSLKNAMGSLVMRYLAYVDLDSFSDVNVDSVADDDESTGPANKKMRSE